MSRFPLYGTLGKFTWRMLATVLAGQSIIIFFGALVARGVAVAGGDDDAQRLLWVGSGIAVLSLVAAGSMRRPFGVTLGWLVQLLTWLSALVVPAMVGAGLVFTGLWFLSLVQGQRADALTAQRERDAEAAPRDGSLG